MYRPSFPEAPTMQTFPGRSWECMADTLQVEAGVFEIEVALDLAHDRVVDAAAATKLEDGAMLGREELVAEPLVVGRPVFDRAVAFGVEAGAKALAAEVVEPAQPVGGVLQHPLLVHQLLEAREGGFGRMDARLGLLLLHEPVLLEAEAA